MRAPGDKPEADLAAYFRDGDPKALGELFESLADYLRRRALQWTGDPEVAEDALQLTFLSILQDSTFRVGRSPMPWILSVLRHRAVELLRANSRRRSRLSDVDASELQAATDPSLKAELAETRDRLLALIRGDRSVYRTALTMHVLRGMSVEEISRELGAPANTVRSRINRAMARLRERLGREERS